MKKLSVEIDSEFENLLKLFDISMKYSDSDYNAVLELAKDAYVREMNKILNNPKFIRPKKFEDLHKDSLTIAQNELKEKSPFKYVRSEIKRQFDQTIEIIYGQFKKQNQINIPISKAIGIDLGTTYCCVSVLDGEEVVIVPNMYGQNTTPSYVSYKEDGVQIVGNTAKEELYSDPSNTIYDVKRLIGRKFDEELVQKRPKSWPFKLTSDNNTLKIELYKRKKSSVYPQEVSAIILKKLKDDANKFLGYEAKNAVITVPAYFNEAQRLATKEAGQIAGLNVLQILNEPTAAAIAYSHKFRDDISRNVLVYDLGGGTFDVAIVELHKGNIKVRAIGGDTHLSGVDFDERMVQFCVKKFEDDSVFQDLTDNKRAIGRLRNYCERKKWDLSSNECAIISIDQLVEGFDFRYTMKRVEFENLCKDLFEKTIDIVDKTLKDAQMTTSDIYEVVLIGGSTRIPKIQDMLEKYFNGKPLNMKMKPDEAVAYGAAIQAAVLNSEQFISSEAPLVIDVTPFSIGIRQIDGTVCSVIPKNSEVQTKHKKTFQTTENNQKYVVLEIFEGEHKLAKNNRLIGQFKLEGIPPKPAGVEKIDVFMEIDKEGILHVTGVTSNNIEKIAIENHRGRIPAEEIKLLKEKI